MINRILRAVAGLALTGALVLLAMAWGQIMGRGTSVDTNGALQMAVLVGALLIFPITGLLRSRRR